MRDAQSMDSRKHQKRSKWLSKVFGKEGTSQRGQTSKLAAVGPSSTQAFPHGTTRQVTEATATSEPPPPPYTVSHKNTTQSAAIVQTTETADISQSLKLKDGAHSSLPEGEAEDPQASDVKVASLSDIKDTEQPKPGRMTGLQTPAKKKEELKAPTVAILSAPAVDTRKTAKGSSRTQKAEFKDEEAVPRILDPKVSMCSAGFWEKAYTQMSDNEKHKELFIKYEAILDENFPSKADNASFPQKMEANVQKQISVMKQKQWVLQWDKKSIVIRDQAERIVKFVQTFSALGDAIAQIDPIQLVYCPLDFYESKGRALATCLESLAPWLLNHQSRIYTNKWAVLGSLGPEFVRFLRSF